MKKRYSYNHCPECIYFKTCYKNKFSSLKDSSCDPLIEFRKKHKDIQQKDIH